jgi:membrane associated rhomboid family serine protease
MSLIELTCHCGRQFRVSPATLGRSGRCPACQARLRLIAPGFRPDEDRFDSRLIVEAGPHHQGEQFLLSGPGPIELGKLPERHIHLDSQQVSRLHCRLVRSKAGWRISDCKSTNGTLVNRDRVDGAELYDGDTLTIGDYLLRFHGRVRSAKAAAPAARPPIPPPVPVPPADGGNLLSDDFCALSEGDAVELAPATAPTPDGHPPEPVPTTGGPICPACERSLAPNAKICVFCGIDLATGRPIITANEGQIEILYENAEKVLSWVSWILPIGFTPVASEAFGTRKPYVVYALAALTTLFTLLFWMYEWTESTHMLAMKNCMLWIGKGELDAERVQELYDTTSYGDSAAFASKLDELVHEAEKSRKHKLLRHEEAELVLTAHNALPPEQQAIGEFRPYQLLTSAFLDIHILSLVTNLIFLLVIGSRVNALIGNTATVLLYPMLAMLGSIVQMLSVQNLPPAPFAGAAPAVMGLAGMYLLLMPFHRVHVASWLRWGSVLTSRLRLKLYTMSGFWLVVSYISLDVLYTFIGTPDDVAPWANLAAFVAGMAIAFLFLTARLVNARGGDLFSGTLGRRAWGLVGKPNPEKKPLLQRLP